MLSRGTLTILAIITLGVSMASVAVWYHHRSGQKCLEIWGIEGANLIRHAKQIEALRLGPRDTTTSNESAEPIETLTFGDREVAVLGRLDISQARGLLHARHALIVDHNFDPEQQSASLTPSWQYALRFHDGDREVLLAFDPDHDYVRLYPIDRGQGLRGATMRAVVAFVEREFAEAKK